MNEWMKQQNGGRKNEQTMLIEHLLETRIDGQTQIGPLHTGRSGLYQHDQVSSFIQCHGDNFLEGKQRTLTFYTNQQIFYSIQF